LNTDELQKIRILLSHSDRDHQLQGEALTSALSEDEFAQLFRNSGFTHHYIGGGSRQAHSISLKYDEWPALQLQQDPLQFVENNLATQFIVEGMFRVHKATVSEMENLTFHGYSNLTNLDFLSDHPSVKWLNCASTSVTNIDGLRGISSLEDLDLSFCPIVDLSAVAAIPRLLFLRLHHNPNLTNASFEGLRGHPKLVEIHTKELKNLTSLSAFADMPRLIKLDLTAAANLTTLDGLKELPKLREVILYSCGSLTNLDALQFCPALQLIDVSTWDTYEPDWDQHFRGQNSLVSIEGILGLKHLKKVKLANQEHIPKAQKIQLREILVR